jgi:gliding motility-associated-like protein
MNSAYVRLLVLLFLSFGSNAQQLFINEVSQGTSGAKEYVEFVVVGNATCQTPVPTIDLRGVIIDDNNGLFATGSGTGIASGAVRFANNVFWSAIPQGTLIVVYNNSDINPLLPPNDASMTDNNCRLVLPANSSLLEGQSISPTTSVTTYPATATWVAGSGSWSQLGMANGGDSFQIRSSNTATTASHAVSWGNNTLNNQIYFSTIGGGVFSMMNTTNNLPTLQGNWTVGSVETPGAANNTANAAWISSMNPQCGTTPTSIQLTLTPTPVSCLGGATGAVSSSISGGTAPYTYLWNNNATSSGLTNIAAGTYTLTVTDATGCTASAQATISSNSGVTVTTTATNASCVSNCNGAIITSVSGGTAPYTYLWSTSASSPGLQNLCAGTYIIAVSDANGCVDTAHAQVYTGIGPTVTTTPTNASCASNCNGAVSTSVSGGTTPYTYLWSTSASSPGLQNLCAGTYIIAVNDVNGCVDTAHAQVYANTIANPTVTAAGPFTTLSSSVQLSASPSGGNWSSDCGNCLNSSGVFSPSTAGPGTYQICYQIGTAPCTATSCITITVTNGCSPIDTFIQTSICPDSSFVVNGQPFSNPGTYAVTLVNGNGCDSTVHLTLQNFPVIPINISTTICPGDTLNYWGYSFTQAIQFSQDTITSDGCPVTNTLTISEQSCDTVEFSLFAPNAITANDDNTNDVFEILLTGAQADEGYILNRWGEIIKTFSIPDLSWDGITNHGLKASDGVYTWILFYTPTNGNRQSAQGFVTLLR